MAIIGHYVLSTNLVHLFLDCHCTTTIDKRMLMRHSYDCQDGASAARSNTSDRRRGQSVTVCSTHLPWPSMAPASEASCQGQDQAALGGRGASYCGNTLEKQHLAVLRPAHSATQVPVRMTEQKGNILGGC